MQFILEQYNQTRSSQPGIDKSSSVYEIIEKKLPFYISGLLKDDKYIVDGSVGVGRWAEVPWIGIFNKNITTSAQKGFYICYLFGNNMESVYLTIIHSITKETSGKSWGKDQIKSFVQQKRRNLKAHIPNLNTLVENNVFIDDPTTLAKSARAQKYSESTIAYKEYAKDKIPSEESLINDLRLFIELYECMDIAENNAGNVAKVVQIEDAEPSIREEQDELNYDKAEIVTDLIQRMGSELTSHILTYIKSKGFNYSEANIKNLYLSLRSKPFVIISGISGTGKTKIVQLFAESIGATEDNGQFMLIPVRPDWSDGSELLGYTDIAGDFKEGPLTKLLIHAKEHPKRPHFLLLDEMNLARVEYYFSDILSVMESRSLTAEGFSSSKLAETADGEPLFFPDNLYIIGTVNMDETTHPFSKKVLDRANTLQFNEIDLLNLNFLKESTDDQIEPMQLANESLQASYIQISHIYPQHEELIVKISNELDRINNILKPIHAQVGYRVRDEICFYLAHNAEANNLLSENEALDFCFMQKILPRIAGSGERVDNVLTELARVLNEEALPLCTAKIKEMQEKLEYDEFTAFW